MGASKTRIQNKYANIELDDVTRYPEESITKIKLLMVDQNKLNLHIYYAEMMTYIFWNLPEVYNNIVESAKDKMDDRYDPLTIKSINEELSVKYN